MTLPGRTLVVFGSYLLAVGLIVLLVPNVLLSTLGLPQTDEPWIRIAGLLVVVLGGYYMSSGRAEGTAFARASVPGRLFVATGLVVVAALWGYWALLLFAVPDAASAAWTWTALRRSADAVTAPASAA